MRFARTLSVFGTGAALLCVGVIGATPAWATVGTSQGFAGYQGAVATATTTMTTDVTVPAVTCSKKVKNSMYLTADMGGISQGSENASGMQVLIGCTGKKAFYEVYLLIDGENAGAAAVSAGNKLSFTGSASSSAENYTITTPSSALSGTGGGLAVSEINVWAQASTAFAPFHTITFSDIKVNGKPFSKISPTGFSDVDASNSVEIQTSALANKDAFTLTYVTNS
jgi:hypothetical protein